MRIVLVGNPNCGKTTVFNALTGYARSAGNWSGVTIDKKEALLKRKYEIKDQDIMIVDLPGAYSVSPYTLEESITSEYILSNTPDVIVSIVDGANISRSLFLTTQLMELGLPVIVIINKYDVILKRSDQIDLDELSSLLKCPVISTVATKEEGIEQLLSRTVQLVHNYSKDEVPINENKEKLDGIERQKYVDRIIQKIRVNEIASHKIRTSDRIDQIVAHKWLGIPIFFLVMWFIFTFSINGVGGLLSGFFNDVLFGEFIPNIANDFFESLGISVLLQALIVDGVIGGVGAVIGFLPLIMTLFFCLSILEDSGYMSRVAVVMDRFFKKIGLSGKSIIPMIVGSGCAIPGIMATRTIEDVNERRMTSILTPFVPCGAKLPIIALFGAVFFPNATWVGPSMYLLSIGMIILGGLLLQRLFKWEKTSRFIVELPEYKRPSISYATTQMLDKAKAFVYKATTIILVCNTFVWFTQAYGWGLKPVEDQSLSILASIGSVVSPFLLPLGISGWQYAASALTGFIAKENVVASLAVIFASGSEEVLYASGGVLNEMFNPITALAFLVFNLFTPPCFAAIGAMNSELGSKKWLWRALGFQFLTGYVLAIIIAQLGTVLMYHKVAIGFLPAMLVVSVVLVSLYVMIKRKDKEIDYQGENEKC